MATPQRLAVIITALPVERAAVIEHLRNVGPEPELRGSIYRRGIFDERSEPWDVIIAEIGAGNEGAAAEAERVIAHYSPQVALFVGVAGAIKDLKQGDVIASTKVYGYESGKDQPEGFRPRPSVQLPDYSLEQRARYEAGEQDWRQRIKGGTGLASTPSAKVGPIVAGEKVLASNRSQIYQFIRRIYGDALAVEMEGHGFLLGVRMNHPTQGIVVRGISDSLSDKDEANDENWQPVAARHAAAFAFQILGKLPPSGGGFPKTTNASAPAQQASIGNVTGNNNTVTINQTQGPSFEDFARLMQAVAPDGNAEIDAACAHMTGGEVGIAIHLLTELRKKRWDRLSPREKYRVEANIGQALERKGEFKEAAKHYIEAKRHQPQEDRARALEAIAYYHLDDKAKAYGLAGEVIRDHPNCSLAIAIRIRSAPSEVSLADLEGSVPEELREDVEILHALGWRALSSGDVAAAERFASAARRRHPDSVEIKDHHATVIVQIEGRARQANQTVNREKLEEAVAELTEGIAKTRGQKDEARLRYNRAEAYDLLGQTEDAETDFRAAIEDDKDEPDMTRRFALFLMRHDRTDAAIEALRKADRVKQNHINRFMLAGLLGERKGAGDWEAAIALLRETLPQNPEPDTRAAMVATITQLLGLLKRHEEAIACLDRLGDGYLCPAVSGAIRSMVLLRAGRKEEAQASARQAMQSLGTDSPETDRMRVAEALGYAGAKSEALTIWKEVLKPDSADVFVCTALEFAKETGDDAFIISFCRGLRASVVRHPFTLELEVMTLEKYKAFDDAISVMREYIAATPDDDLSRVFRVRLSLLGLRLDRPELVEADVAKLPPVETAHVKVGAATAHVLKNGPCPERGIEYAYELVRRHFDDPLARQAYVGVVGVGDDEVHFPEPTAVASGCAVKYRADDTGEEKWVIVEDGAEPSSEREEIGPGHPWAKDMAGKAVGEKFHLRRDPLQSRTATIQAICNKYVYRKFEIINGWEDRFPDQPFARKYTFPTKEDGSPDISLILKALDLQEQQKEELHAIYRNNPISATTFARVANAGLLESLSHLASEGSLPIRCCRGTTEELERAEASLAGADTIVLEPSALATLFFSGQYEHLELLQGKSVICESALEEYTELRRKFASSAHGFVGKFKGKYLFREDNPAERQRQEKRLDTFLTKIRPLVTMRSGESLAGLSREHREKLIDLFGQPTAEAIAEAAASGAILWTDDIAVAEVAREQAGVERRVWTQLVFRSVAPPEVYADLTLFLLQWRYFFTRVEPEVVLAACRTGSWDPNAPVLRRIVEWLSMPELLHLGAAQVCALSLVLIWKQAIDIGQKEGVAQALLRAVLRRQDGRQTVISLGNNLDAIFEGDKVARGQCAPVIQDVLKMEAKPANDGSRAAWAKVLLRFERKTGLSGARVPVQPAPKDGRIKQASDPTPKERAERRKADRKRKKGRG